MVKKAFDELKLTGRLPSPPGVGMAIIQLTQTDDYDVEDVARIIRSDPALAGRVLKLCNSGAKAGIRTISSIDEGIQRLGIRTLRTVALGFSLISAYREGTCANFDFSRFWSESLARAIAAQEVAVATSYPAPADAYACGLLAGIGRLALACVHTDQYARVIEAFNSLPDANLLELEKAAFEINSNEVSQAVLSDWGIPKHLVLASTVTDSRVLKSESKSVQDLSHLIAIATAIGRVCIGGEEATASDIASLEEALGQSAMGREEFHALCDRVAAEWLNWGGMLELPTIELPSFSDIVTKEAPDNSNKAATDQMEEAHEALHRPLRILACDDERVSLKLLVHHLKSRGHEVIEAHDGAQALGLALERLPDVIVSDLRMPRMDGIELVKSLRRCDEGRQMYVLMLTGADDENLAVESFEAGIDDYIMKPFNPRILLARVRAGERVVRMQRQLEADSRQMREQMSELAVLNRKLQQASMTDPLTELPNRRFAMAQLQSYWAEALRHDDEVAAIMIDIDHFKRVNDLYGHDAGDEVLRQTARILQQGIREHECICRLGGEEFLVICHRAKLADAEVCAERLRRMVEDNHIHYEGFEESITISLGAASTRPLIEGYEALLRSADEAVYAAKRSGRNRVCSSHPGALV